MIFFAWYATTRRMNYRVPLFFFFVCMYADVLLYDELQDGLQKLVSKVMSDDRENVFAHLQDARFPLDYKVQGKSLMEFASEKVPFEAAEFERAYRCRMVPETRLKKI